MATDNDKTSIMNMALSHIKQRQITSPSEASEQARKCNLFYDKARRATLRACDWNFTRVVQPLTLLGSQDAAQANPTNGALQDVIPQWNYLYVYPPKCIRARKIFNPRHPIIPSPWNDRTIQERWGKLGKFEVVRSPVSNQMAIATNLESASIEYTFDITDESQFDDMFVDGFSFALAQRIAFILTADKEIVQMMSVEFDKVIGEAKRKNGGEGTEESPRQSNYEQARE